MEPIVNPWIFYWINVVEGISIVACISAFLLLISIVVLVIVGVAELSYEEESSKRKMKLSKKLGVYCAISFFFAIFAPGKPTMIQMLMAAYVTPDNYEAVKMEGKEAIDYIIETIINASKAEKED